MGPLKNTRSFIESLEEQRKNSGGSFSKIRSKKQSMRSNATGYTLRGKSFKDMKNTLKNMTAKLDTLGSGNMLFMIEIPEDTYLDNMDKVRHLHPDMNETEQSKLGRKEARQEWLVVNTMDFFNETVLLYSMLEDFHEVMSVKELYDKEVETRDKDKPPLPEFYDGFPLGFEYRIQTGSGKSKDEKHDAHWYVNACITWIEDLIDNPAIFPEHEDEPFPDDLEEKNLPEIFKRLFRMYAIIYNVLWPVVVEYDAEKHVNTTFKHFYFFSKRYNLLRSKYDLDAFVKTKLKKRKIIDIAALDKEYDKCLKQLVEGRQAAADNMRMV